MSADSLWVFLPLGYLITVAIETPVLLVGLSRRHKLSDRIIAGFWLTACTYPIVVLALPALMYDRFPRWQYLLVAEVFAPVAECILFWFAYDREPAADRRTVIRDSVVVVLANLASFGIGEALHALGML